MALFLDTVSTKQNKKPKADSDGTLTCSVRGNPMPQITWYYNKVIIPLDSPKYRQIRNKGLCQLDIRKAMFGDGGSYMCHAKNELGEDWVSANLPTLSEVTKTAHSCCFSGCG